MKTAICMAAAILCATPALSVNIAGTDAALRKSTTEFCESIRQANLLGRSVHPDAPMGQDIAKATDPKGNITYKDLWYLAKGSGIQACDAMW